MKLIDPAEISALLDGELPADRAAEVRRAIAQDPALRRTYDQLAAVDADLSACAAATVFHPRVSLPAGRTLTAIGVVPLAIVMLLVRVAAKLVPIPSAMAIQAVALAVIVGLVVGRLLAVSDANVHAVTTAAQPSA